MRKFIFIILLLSGLAVAGWIGLRQWEDQWLVTPLPALQVPRNFIIEPGTPVARLARQLEEAGLIDYDWVWVRHARRLGVDTRIKAGEYELAAGSTPIQLLDQFVFGRVRLYSVTLVEGWTFRQALSAIQSKRTVRVEFKDLADEEIMFRLGLKGRHPEGMFFPDTYLFSRGTSDREILDQAHRRLQQELEAAWSARSDDLPLQSAYEALILASIVEKETGAAEERPEIAGVFVNRLRQGMRLQTDPTVIYGMGSDFDGNIRKSDLRRDTPYNTYTRGGLPPTPIALVGQAALLAATQPASTEAMYFVASGMGDGRHLFAESLVEHNRNVSRHLTNLRRGAGVHVR